jgi:hypothetical protein
MKQPLAEDIRSILNKLDEYITSVQEDDRVDTDETLDEQGETSNPKNPKGDDAANEPVDKMLTKPADLEKIVGNINVQSLITMLEIPEDHVANFKSAINALRHDEPRLSQAQAMALAIAFNHMMTLGSTEKTKIATTIRPVTGVIENLDDNKLKSYIAKDQSSASSPDTISQMKSMIDAVKNHGTPTEKKEIGLNENSVEIIGYNSGHGEKLDVVAQDPKRRRKVEMIQLRLGDRGQPELVFKDTDGDKYVADWNTKYGWVADFD